MQQFSDNSLAPIPVIFGDALFKLYPFAGTQSTTERIAWHIPISHEHSFFEFMLAGKKGYRIELGEHTDALKPHHGYIIPAGVAHCAAETEGMSNLSIGFTIEPFGTGKPPVFKILRAALLAAAKQAMPIAEETQALFDAFYACDGNYVDTLFRKHVLAYRLVYGIFRDMHIIREGWPVNGTQPINPVMAMEFLLERRQYRLEEIAAILGYTPQHTAQLIRKQYGCDFRTLRRRMLLDGAKNYLQADPRIPIRDIAHLLGYKSPSAFYDFFRREMGCTPDEYRQQVLPRTGEEHNEHK